MHNALMANVKRHALCSIDARNLSDVPTQARLEFLSLARSAQLPGR